MTFDQHYNYKSVVTLSTSGNGIHKRVGSVGHLTYDERSPSDLLCGVQSLTLVVLHYELIWTNIAQNLVKIFFQLGRPCI